MIHAILIAYENPEQTLVRWTRDVAPALKLAGATFGLETVATVVDNSAGWSPELARAPDLKHVWNHGRNLQYGPAINQAVRHTPAAFVLYACTRHGRAFDPTWACDLLAPLIDNPVVGMTGCLWGSNSPEGVAAAGGKEWPRDGRYRFTHADGTGHVPQHVQGGVFAARNELLMRCPYHPDYPHLYTDHLVTWDALKAGYTVLDVPSVRSIWRSRWDKPMDGIKYLHDEAHT